VKPLLVLAALCAALALATFSGDAQSSGQAQQPPARPQPQQPTADPYAANPDAGKTKFPLAGYRNTINDNVVLILMIETLEGVKNADEIAKVPGVTALFAASGDFGNFTGYRQGTPDYERAINIVHDATIKAGVRLCGPLSWRDRPDFTCFQAGSETAAISRGAVTACRVS
jgi:2-keto-3-deoxy-L-rhamnonate aldolase RhmA